jgi:hypothetical protein
MTIEWAGATLITRFALCRINIYDFIVETLCEGKLYLMGMYVVNVQLISGCVLPIWPVIEKTFKNSMDPSTGRSGPAPRIQIVRASISFPEEEAATGKTPASSVHSLIGVSISNDKTAAEVTLSCI